VQRIKKRMTSSHEDFTVILAQAVGTAVVLDEM
jgi:hypothetical protein